MKKSHRSLGSHYSTKKKPEAGSGYTADSAGLISPLKTGTDTAMPTLPALDVIGNIRECLNKDLIDLQVQVTRFQQVEDFVRINFSESKTPQPEMPKYVQ